MRTHMIRMSRASVFALTLQILLEIFVITF